MRLALYQPDIPQNVGALIRLGACLSVPLDIIEPCGFPFSDRSLKRAALDYADFATVKRHTSFEAFERWRAEDGGRLLLLTTRGATPFTAHRFDPRDILLIGRESAGVPEEVHERADARLLIPMVDGARSLNMALAATLVLAEALRQTDAYP